MSSVCQECGESRLPIYKSRNWVSYSVCIRCLQNKCQCYSCDRLAIREGELCSGCSELQLVENRKDLYLCFAEAFVWLRRKGVRLKKGHVQVLFTRLPVVNGRCVIEDNSVKVEVQFRLPWVKTVSVLVHELFHLWTFKNVVQVHDQEVEEALCIYLARLYLSEQRAGGRSKEARNLTNYIEAQIHHSTAKARTGLVEKTIDKRNLAGVLEQFRVHGLIF